MAASPTSPGSTGRGDLASAMPPPLGNSAEVVAPADTPMATSITKKVTWALARRSDNSLLPLQRERHVDSQWTEPC